MWGNTSQRTSNITLGVWTDFFQHGHCDFDFDFLLGISHSLSWLVLFFGAKEEKPPSNQPEEDSYRIQYYLKSMLTHFWASLPALRILPSTSYSARSKKVCASSDSEHEFDLSHCDSIRIGFSASLLQHRKNSKRLLGR